MGLPLTATAYDRRRAGRGLGFLALALLTAVCVVVLAQRPLLAVFDPLPAVDLAQAHAWFIDWRLAALRDRPDLCRRVLVLPYIEASAIPDRPLKDGCGWSNSVRVTAAGGAHAGFDKLTCESAAALALWLEHEVQPLARQYLGQHVASIQSLGGYACRNIVGNRLWETMRSQHAVANAMDIEAFKLADGRRISVRKDWNGSGAEGAFLKAVHRGACRYFHVVLGPNYNGAHRDHFHLDRGFFHQCK